jgi:hypothetical protein
MERIIKRLFAFVGVVVFGVFASSSRGDDKIVKDGAA